MAIDKDIAIAKIKAFSKQHINSAGARYTPGIDPDAPNIHNEDLFRTLNHLTCGPEVEEEFAQIRQELRKRWADSSRASEQRDVIDTHVGVVDQALEVLAGELREGRRESLKRFLDGMAAINDQLGKEEAALAEKERQVIQEAHAKSKDSGGGDSNSEAGSKFRSALRDLRQTSSYTADILERYQAAPVIGLP